MQDTNQNTSITGKTKLTRVEKSWIMYDWANSVYATIMMAAIFPIYFTSVTNGYFAPLRAIAERAGEKTGWMTGDYWWGIGTSAAMIITALLAPIVGALSDFAGYRKKIFSVFFAIGVGFTFASAFFDNWVLLLMGYAVSHIGFAGGNLVYDSFLADVTTPERMDKISGYGYAFGYIGGSTIPFLISIALVTFSDKLGITESFAIKISVMLTAVWWGLFTIPFLKNVRQTHSVEKSRSQAAVRAAFSSAVQTAKKIFNNKQVLFYTIAYFFYIDGVGTVINMSTSYGETLGLDRTSMVLALLVTQFVAIPFSIWYARLTKRFGSLRMIRIAVCEYLVICTVGFLMGFGLEQRFFGIETATTLFWILATMVGTVQGGIQALSRSYFCQMIPPENSGEFFGFFDIFGKFAAVLGPLLYAVVKSATESAAFAILSIAVLFLVGLIMLGKCGKYDAKTAV